MLYFSLYFSGQFDIPVFMRSILCNDFFFCDAILCCVSILLLVPFKTLWEDCDWSFFGGSFRLWRFCCQFLIMMIFWNQVVENAKMFAFLQLLWPNLELNVKANNKKHIQGYEIFNCNFVFSSHFCLLMY